MPSIAIRFSDVTEKGRVGVATDVNIDYQGCREDDPATSAMMFALTVTRLLEEGTLERLVLRYCSKEIAEAAALASSLNASALGSVTTETVVAGAPVIQPALPTLSRAGTI